MLQQLAPDLATLREELTLVTSTPRAEAQVCDLMTSVCGARLKCCEVTSATNTLRRIATQMKSNNHYVVKSRAESKKLVRSKNEQLVEYMCRVTASYLGAGNTDLTVEFCSTGGLMKGMQERVPVLSTEMTENLMSDLVFFTCLVITLTLKMKTLIAPPWLQPLAGDEDAEALEGLIPESRGASLEEYRMRNEQTE